MAGQAQKQLAPFRMNTRQRIQRIVRQAIAEDTRYTFTLPQVGYLRGIWVTVYGDLAITGGALADLGPWNILKRIQLVTNMGSANLIDLSGYGAFLLNRTQNRAFSPDGDSAGGTNSLFFFSTGAYDNVSTGAKMTFFLPVSANDAYQFMTGLINLQAPEVRVTLNLETETYTNVHSGITSGTLNVDIAYEYYEVPNPNDVQQVPVVLHRVIEDVQAISNTGDQVYTVPRQGVLLSLQHLVRLNDARNSFDVDQLVLRVNKTDDIYNMYTEHYEYMHGDKYSKLPVTGEFIWDLWHSDKDPSAGDMRDTLDTEAVSTLESIVTVGSGAALGSNNNYLHSIRRIVQPVQLG